MAALRLCDIQWVDVARGSGFCDPLGGGLILDGENIVPLEGR